MKVAEESALFNVDTSILTYVNHIRFLKNGDIL